MRVMLFRGKTNNGEWVYGVPIKCYDGDFQICTDSMKTTVITKTVGQYTGLKDCNGKEIYEGDIVAIETANISVECDGYFVIKYDTLTARFVCEGNGLVVDFDNVWSDSEVAIEGNIHDNPELIEKE